MSTVYEIAADTVDRFADDFTDGFETVKEIVVPAATVAVGAGSTAAMSVGRVAMRRPVLVIGGGLALLAVVVWIARRGGSASDDRQAHGVESKDRNISAA